MKRLMRCNVNAYRKTASLAAVSSKSDQVFLLRRLR